MYSFNKREKDGNEIIDDYRWRWNHDKKHPHPNKDSKNACRYNRIECKSIFKTNSFKIGTQHFPYPIKKMFVSQRVCITLMSNYLRI